MERRAAHAAEEGARELPARDRARPGERLRDLSARARCYKSQGQWEEALADVRRRARPRARSRAQARASPRRSGDAQGRGRSRRRVPRARDGARRSTTNDPALQQEYAASIARAHRGRRERPRRRSGRRPRSSSSRSPRSYDGEHGLAYSAGALDIEPGHDRALQLYVYYARALGREDGALGSLPRLRAGQPRRRDGDRGAPSPSPPSYEGAGHFQRGHRDARAAARRAATPRRPRSSATSTRSRRGPSAERAARPAAGVPGSPATTPAASLREAAGVQRLAPQGRPRRPTSSRESSTPRRCSSSKGKKPEAYAKYKEVLESDPAHPEALSWVEDYLRTKRDYADSCATCCSRRAHRWPRTPTSTEARKERLREVAGLCEGNLRDIDGAIDAWKQLLAHRPHRRGRAAVADAPPREGAALGRPREPPRAGGDRRARPREEDRAREEARGRCRRRSGRTSAPPPRRGPASPTSRPRTSGPSATASKMFEKAGRIDPAARGHRRERRERSTDPVAQGEPARAPRRAARAARTIGRRRRGVRRGRRGAEERSKLWEAAERCFVGGGAVGPRGERRRSARAPHRATRSSRRSTRPRGGAPRQGRRPGGRRSRASSQATDLDPATEEYATQLSRALHRPDASGQTLVAAASRSAATSLTDKAKRVALRRQAANLYATQLGDKEGARETWLKVLEDGDDNEALEKLVDDAIERERSHRGHDAPPAPRQHHRRPRREGAHRAARGRAPRRGGRRRRHRHRALRADPRRSRRRPAVPPSRRSPTSKRRATTSPPPPTRSSAS